GMGPGKWIAQPWHIFQRKIERALLPELKRGQRLACIGFGEPEKIERCFRRRKRNDRRLALDRHREKFEARRRDDRERTFRADQEIAQIIAGVVFLEAAKPMPDAPVGKNGFETQRKATSISVGKDRSTTGIRRQR